MKKLFHHPLTVRALAALIAGYMYLVFATSRVHVITPLPAVFLTGPVVLASWHQQILMIPVMRRSNPGRLLALISDSRAGTFIRTVAAWFGIGAVAGSPTRGGIAGARLLIKAAREGHALYITPDGSRGPACEAKEGATEIARLTRLPLIPCAAWPSRGKCFNTWDKFRFPYPFSTIRVAYGDPLEDLTPSDLSVALNKLTAQVQGNSAPLATPL
ncbi:lysophospholipid acyltransferase family protein [Rhizobium sp. KVB221]|uniref:Lysophospholipid acyltransferase family protein n=1 Tax=Rhizobium setariae TaxID=2801340 RepID=A0A936YPR6_9HYPH|nr:lysophospholipid acyltransferase family protein [Rhizobium setariae]MBL0374458.1 lysophospholipid acyltransferase family protein [Rhizobium setariae]